jgi:hypothetical protein
MIMGGGKDERETRRGATKDGHAGMEDREGSGSGGRRVVMSVVGIRGGKASNGVEVWKNIEEREEDGGAGWRREEQSGQRGSTACGEEVKAERRRAGRGQWW